MEPIAFQPENCYKVFFEKAVPIVFKFVKVDDKGRLLCEDRSGQLFDFNSLDQHLSIKEEYPGW